MFIQYETAFHILLTDVQNNSVYLYIHKLFEICIAQVALKSEAKNTAVVIHKWVMYNYHMKYAANDDFFRKSVVYRLMVQAGNIQAGHLILLWVFYLFIFSDCSVRKIDEYACLLSNIS